MTYEGTVYRCPACDCVLPNAQEQYDNRRNETITCPNCGAKLHAVEIWGYDYSPEDDCQIYLWVQVTKCGTCNTYLDDALGKSLGCEHCRGEFCSATCQEAHERKEHSGN